MLGADDDPTGFRPELHPLVAEAARRRPHLRFGATHRLWEALVPAVIDGDVVLRESNTIVRYLATKHGRTDLYPLDLAARANVEQWMDWANYETSISLRGAFLGGMLNEPPWNNPWFIEQGRRQIIKEVGQLDQHFTAAKTPYVAGATFTVADIPIGLVVNRWFSLTNFERPQYPAVAAYYDRLGERPAYRRHVRNGLP